MSCTAIHAQGYPPRSRELFPPVFRKKNCKACTPFKVEQFSRAFGCASNLAERAEQFLRSWASDTTSEIIRHVASLMSTRFQAKAKSHLLVCTRRNCCKML